MMLSKAFKWTVFALSLCVLVGWYYDIDLLKRLLIGSIFMNPITATLFLLISLSAIIELVVLNKLAFLIFYGFVIVVCLCKLADYVIGLSFKIDHLFFGDFFNGNDKVYSMAPTTAMLFIFFSLAQWAHDFKKYLVKDILLVATLLVNAFVITGYVMKVPEFQVAIPLFPALQTCILFLFLIFSTYFYQPTVGLPSLLVSNLEGAKVGRLLFPLIVLIPFTIGYIRLVTFRSGTHSNELGIAVVVLCYIIIFSAILFITVRYLNNKDQLRNEFISKINALNYNLNDANNQQLALNEELAASNEEAQASNEELTAMNEKLSEALQTIRDQNAVILQHKEEALIRSQQHLDIIFTNTTEGILLMDVTGRIIAINTASKKFIKIITGKIPEVGMFLWDVTVPERFQEVKEVFQSVLAGKIIAVEVPFDTPKGHFVQLLKYEPVIIKGKVVCVTVISSNITERVAAAEKLKTNFEELKKTNYELDRFVYSASHDLRAPLSSILGLINLAEMEANSKESTYLQMIKGRIHHLDGFIKDILDYSRNARSETTFQEINFEVLLHESDVALKLISSYEKLIVTFEIKNETAFYSDPLRLTIIFNNLISNAIKFQDSNKQESFLSIIVSTNEQEAYVQIKDNGIGIEEQHMPKIFNMFYRGTERSNGSGIGLYIVKETVEKLGGSISVESIFGAYTLFEVKIPNAISQNENKVLAIHTVPKLEKRGIELSQTQQN